MFYEVKIVTEVHASACPHCLERLRAWPGVALCRPDAGVPEEVAQREPGRGVV